MEVLTGGGERLGLHGDEVGKDIPARNSWLQRVIPGWRGNLGFGRSARSPVDRLLSCGESLHSTAGFFSKRVTSRNRIGGIDRSQVKRNTMK